MWNVEFNRNIFFFYILFIQTKINEQTEQKKIVVRIVVRNSIIVQACFHAILTCRPV